MNRALAPSFAATACALACSLASAQVKPPLAAPVQVVNGTSQPVPVTLTNPQVVKTQSPAMFRVSGSDGSALILVPSPAAGTVFVVQHIDMLVESNNGVVQTAAQCSFRLQHPDAGGGTVSESLAAFALAPTPSAVTGTGWSAHYSVYWVLKAQESIEMTCASLPGNVFVLGTAGGFSMPSP